MTDEIKTTTKALFEEIGAYVSDIVETKTFINTCKEIENEVMALDSSDAMDMIALASLSSVARELLNATISCEQIIRIVKRFCDDEQLEKRKRAIEIRDRQIERQESIIEFDETQIHYLHKQQDNAHSFRDFDTIQHDVEYHHRCISDGIDVIRRLKEEQQKIANGSVVVNDRLQADSEDEI